MIDADPERTRGRTRFRLQIEYAKLERLFSARYRIYGKRMQRTGPIETLEPLE